MADLRLLEYAIGHVVKMPVHLYPHDAWHQLVREDGLPTYITLPEPLAGLASRGNLVLAAGSGIYNPDPGLDAVRWDEKDAPNVYNIDHYPVYEDFCTRAEYPRVRQMLAVLDDKEIETVFQNHVVIVGPVRLHHHHSPEIPEVIAKALHRHDSAER